MIMWLIGRDLLSCDLVGSDEREETSTSCYQAECQGKQQQDSPVEKSSTMMKALHGAALGSHQLWVC